MKGRSLVQPDSFRSLPLCCKFQGLRADDPVPAKLLIAELIRYIPEDFRYIPACSCFTLDKARCLTTQFLLELDLATSWSVWKLHSLPESSICLTYFDAPP